MAKPLREWRTSRVWSVRDLAERAGVSTKTVVQLEHGRQRPTFVTMRRVAEALGVPAAEIEEFAAALKERGRDAAERNPGPRRGNAPAAGRTAEGPRPV